MEGLSLTPLAPRASYAPLPNKWMEMLAPLFAELEQQSRRAAREEFTRLQAEQVDASAEARRNEEPLNVKQAATLLGITPQTVWEWQKRGTLPSYRLGNRIMFRRGEVLAALKAQTQHDGRRKYARQQVPSACIAKQNKKETAANA
jgi:excisionase family DNA binding protein